MPVRGKRYDGQIAVVTGASSGIGRRLAADLRSRGATVVGVARRRQGEVDMTCDVGDEAAYQALLAAVEREHGRIDILLNVAGVDEPVSAANGDLAPYHRVMAVNYFGVVA
jgi:NAD(P)-dependent dehydrogenase (short-subunit alcohol dehydrogenase family)